MRAELGPRTEKVLQIVIDLGERLFILILFASFLATLSRTLGVRPFNVLALISEGWVAFLIVVRRRATFISTRPWDWLIGLGGTALPMLARAGGQPFLPSEVGTVLMFSGLSIALVAKLTLRRSFGIAAANRGAVISGPYRLVRHPIYAGYLLVYLGFALNNPQMWNLLLYVFAAGLLVARTHAEEGVLVHDPVYTEYRLKVRYRLIPGLI